MWQGWKSATLLWVASQARSTRAAGAKGQEQHGLVVGSVAGQEQHELVADCAGGQEQHNKCLK